MLVVPNLAEARALEILLNINVADDLDLKLFKNNYTPVAGSHLGNFDEADFTGYAPYEIDATDWAITPGAPTDAEHPQVTFTSTVGAQNQDVYGYYVVERNPGSNGVVRWAERFGNGPYNIQNLGDQIKVTPHFTGASESAD